MQIKNGSSFLWSTAFLPVISLSTLKFRDPYNKGVFAILYQINLAYKISQHLTGISCSFLHNL